MPCCRNNSTWNQRFCVVHHLLVAALQEQLGVEPVVLRGSPFACCHVAGTTRRGTSGSARCAICLLLPRCRNNSAWNQRFYVVSHCGGFTGAVARREVAYTLQKIDLVTRNESAWNYLRVGSLFYDVKGKQCCGSLIITLGSGTGSLDS
jgi:hypothetical protein